MFLKIVLFYSLSLNFLQQVFMFIITLLFILFAFQIDLKSKLILFIINVFLFSGVGFYFDLDGFVLLLLLTELTLGLVFLAVYKQLYIYTKNVYKYSIYHIFGVYIFLFLLFLYYCNPNPLTLVFVNFYTTIYNINSNDFFILYYFFFECFRLITILVAVNLTLYSLFFILIFFKLTCIKQISVKRKKFIQTLRKQQLLRQFKFKNQIRFFGD